MPSAVLVVRRASACTAAALVCSMACAMICASACEDSPLGAAATTECAPLGDPAVRVTSEALTADGHYVVVVGEGGAARVFYGIPAHMVEGVIHDTRPGCALEIDFEVQGRAYTATLSPDPATCMIASSLVLGDPGSSARTPLTLLRVAGSPIDAGAAAASGPPLMFYCL